MLQDAPVGRSRGGSCAGPLTLVPPASAGCGVHACASSSARSSRPQRSGGSRSGRTQGAGLDSCRSSARPVARGEPLRQLASLSYRQRGPRSIPATRRKRHPPNSRRSSEQDIVRVGSGAATRVDLEDPQGIDLLTVSSGSCCRTSLAGVGRRAAIACHECGSRANGRRPITPARR